MAEKTGASHIRELDGIRGLAILLVLIHHLLILPEGPTISKGLNFIGSLGWMGVDLFFVLSGFLISRILIAGREQPHYFRNFYVRRALRIFPVYYAYLAIYYFVVIKFGILNLDASRRDEASLALPWLLFYGTNILIAIKGTFIVATLNHFWTLAVEEHFYLVWPWIVRKTKGENLLWACVGLVFFAVGLRSTLLMNNVSGFTIHTLSLCRMDDFAIGAMGAILLGSGKIKALEKYLSIMFYSLLALLIAGFLILRTGEAGNPWVQSVGYSIIGLFFLTLILKVISAPSSSSLRRFFGSSWMCQLGKYSYAIYILQVPILVAIKRSFPTSNIGKLIEEPMMMAVAVSSLCLVLSIAGAVISYHCFEKWFLRLKTLF